MGYTFHWLRLRYGAAPHLPPRPLSLWPQHYGIPLSQPFSRVGTLLAHTAQTTSGTRESWKPSFCVNATAVNCIRGHNDSAFACRFNLKEKISQEGLYRPSPAFFSDDNNHGG